MRQPEHYTLTNVLLKTYSCNDRQVFAESENVVGELALTAITVCKPGTTQVNIGIVRIVLLTMEIYFTRSRLRILKIAVVEVQECFYTPHSYEGGK